MHAAVILGITCCFLTLSYGLSNIVTTSANSLLELIIFPSSHDGRNFLLLTRGRRRTLPSSPSSGRRAIRSSSFAVYYNHGRQSGSSTDNQEEDIIIIKSDDDNNNNNSNNSGVLQLFTEQSRRLAGVDTIIKTNSSSDSSNTSCSSSSSSSMKQPISSLWSISSSSSILEEESCYNKNDNNDGSSTMMMEDHLQIYADTENDITLYGLNITPYSKFCAWVNHTISSINPIIPFKERCITTSPISVEHGSTRQELQQKWKEGKLISKRTEPLATYASDKILGTSSSVALSRRRGGFSDMLSVYADRMLGIIKEELEELKDLNQSTYKRLKNPKDHIFQWMKTEYGAERISELQSQNFAHKSCEDQMDTLQSFMSWFRERLPYYYDRCSTCGASSKDKSSSDDNTAEESDSDSAFVGYVYPSLTEQHGLASRTELYLCPKCHTFTRFPRYNAVASVLKQQKGRCGEYAMILFRFLRSCGHEARWVVDWADHVWTEIRIGSRWVHLDPCEAAVDNPLLYESWGKNQTYIMAFYAPPHFKKQIIAPEQSSFMGISNDRQRSRLLKFKRVFVRQRHLTTVFSRREPSLNMTSTAQPIESNQYLKETNNFYDIPLIEDVTATYTSDDVTLIKGRREESEEDFLQAIDEETRRIKKELLLNQQK